MKSKSTSFVLLLSSIVLLSWLILTESHPLGTDSSELTGSLGFSSNELPKDEITDEGKESATRNKRTVGFLRQLFPGISQIIDRKIQQITRILFRVVGRLILRGGGGGTGGGGDTTNGDGGRKISITLPTYGPIEDDEEEEDTNIPGTESSSTAAPDIDTRIDGSESKPVQANETDSNSGTSSNSNTEILSNSENDTRPPDTSNTVVRKSRDVSDVLSDTTSSVDLDLELLSSTESSTTKRNGLLWRLGRDMRSKRGSTQGSSSGSGNFIFDLVRLIAGSGSTPEKDEELNAPRDTREDDGPVEVNDVNDNVTGSSYNPEDDTSGIPGPLTRFALLVNRGIANVFKDLILLCPREDPTCVREQRSKVLTNVVNNAL